MSSSSIPLVNLADLSATAAKYLPEPTIQQSSLFKDVMSVVTKAASTTIGDVPIAVDGSLADLINAQIEAQTQLQSVSMVSNIEHSRHEQRMAAIRNIRTS